MPVSKDRLVAFFDSDQGLPLRYAYGIVVNNFIRYLRFAARQNGKGLAPYSAEFNRDVTIVAKTFSRPKAMNRLLSSIREATFTGKVLVADDSQKHWSTRDPQVEVLQLPFNVGISVGRNRALEKVTTPYVLITDDDLVFTRLTNWQKAYDYLEAHPDVDGVAATLVEVPTFKTHIHGPSHLSLYHGADTPIYEAGHNLYGLPVRVKVPNIFIARADSIRSIGGWDEELRIYEHSDFFSRASGKLVFVQDPGILVYHGRTPWLKTYNKFRSDGTASRRVLSRKWGSQGNRQV
ncbi:glycosyltransferase family 2 protein [Rothia nasimurium]|uniref:glycosyltransferase family 2 protein n=1 Tax=Rothia nasimurium TaxID=85336 RepID=UPI001F1E9717|nr:glycosyltransferase [Rothia nasimurium]